MAPVLLLAVGACNAYAAVDSYPRAESRPPQARDVFSDIAHDLLSSLQAGQRIALQPFRAADVPVSLAVAQSFNDALARAIETAPEAPGIVVAREELPRLFAEAEEFGEPAEAQKLLEAARADVIVIGTMAPVRGGVEISYKAFHATTGRQLASAAPRFRAVDTSAPSGMPLDQALAAAVDAFIRQAPDMKTVETLGIYYQQTEVQTPLGSYIGRELVGRLVEKVSGLQALPAQLLRPELQRVDRLEKGGTEKEMLRARPGVYLLSGAIWDFGADVEVRLSLRGDGDRLASYGVRIRRDAIPASLLPLAPADAQPVRRDVPGPFGVQLSSDRGRRPVYAVGDSAHLVVQSARDGYLYCFHQASANAGGGITKIFPNQYHRDARIQGQTSVHIPDDAMKFTLRVQGPAGVEYVRCFALDRDAGATLPANDLPPANVRSLDDLGTIFRAVPAAGVSEATMVMTIDAQK